MNDKKTYRITFTRTIKQTHSFDVVDKSEGDAIDSAKSCIENGEHDPMITHVETQSTDDSNFEAEEI